MQKSLAWLSFVVRVWGCFLWLEWVLFICLLVLVFWGDFCLVFWAFCVCVCVLLIKASDFKNASPNFFALELYAWLILLFILHFGPDSHGLMYRVQLMLFGLLTVSFQRIDTALSPSSTADGKVSVLLLKDL